MRKFQEVQNRGKEQLTPNKGLDKAFWDEQRAERAKHIANEEAFAPRHGRSMVYDWDVDTRCRVATKKAARSLVRVKRTIKENMDILDQYRHLMDKKPEPFVRRVNQAAAAQELPAIAEAPKKQAMPAKRRPISHRRVLTSNRNQGSYLPSIKKFNF